MSVQWMRQCLMLSALVVVVTACQTNTKTRNELVFPAGIHTWDKNQDYNLSQPSNGCSGCPTFENLSPSQGSLEQADWKFELTQGRSTFNLRGRVLGAGENDCGPNNDLLCSNEWRIWPPGSDFTPGYVMTPGGDLPTAYSFDLDPSFQCGLSRLVLVSENTYGLTRMIVDVDRRGGVCEVASSEPALNVRLVWGTDDTDLDLHLVRDGGELYSADDCYYDNCGVANDLGTSGLDWGVEGSAVDNPLLDVDDTEGGGPENIFLQRAGDQRYDVYVHYFEGMTETFPEIEIWYGTTLVDVVYYSATLPAFSRGGVWKAASIEIGGGRPSVNDSQQTLTFEGR